MSQKLPPLSALRVFRSAAHSLSFTLTAEELFVTQAAVSHQIKSLEEWLGIALFIRGNRKLILSDAGQRLLPYVDQMFHLLDQGLQELKTDNKGLTLTVTVLPSFASRWLVPRLGLFLKSHPEVDFRLAPSRGLTNFQTEDMDLAIRYGSGNYPGLISIHLMDEDIFPVCSPRIMDGPYPLNEPDDLKHHVLLHDEGHGDWRKWLLVANAKSVDASKGPVFTDSAMAVQSAIEADGIALARSELVKADLSRGRLVKPFDIYQPTGFSYYVVYPADRIPNPAMQAFIKWLQRQVRDDETKYHSASPRHNV